MARNNERQIEYQCVYCGLLAGTIDHVPPISVRPTLIDLGLAARYPFLEVRACHECNVGLGARPLWTVAQRKQWIKGWLRRRHRKYLVIPDWTEEELAALGDELRQHTEHGLAVRDLMRFRLAF